MKLLMLLLSMATVAVAQTNVSTMIETNEAMKVCVTGDRVSLRAKPVDGYVLDSAMRGEELVYFEKTNGWVAVQAPASLDFWVAGEYVQNGIIEPAKLNVRAGPSLNYAVVGVLNKGDAVAVRGEFNNWLKIAPPADSRVWISEKYVEAIQPPTPEPQDEATIEPEVVEEDEATPEPASETEMTADQEQLPPLMLVLDKDRKQGVYVEIPGVLRRANPGLFKLVLIDSGFEEPICLVQGNEPQLERYLNHVLLIKGKKYWAKDVELPILQPEVIRPDPILSE